MNDEIKEKVDMIIKKVRVAMIKHREGFYDYDMLVCYELDYNEWKNLLDYITNLQQENESLRERIKTIKRLRKKQTAKKNKYKMLIFNEEKALHDYKSRCEKAIEYMKQHEKDGTLWLVKSTDDLLNILQNGSDR